MRDKLIEAVVNAISEIERAGEPDTIAGPPRKALWHLAGMEQARAEYARCIRAALAAIEDAGYRIVPVEPTDEMLADADSAIPRFEPDIATGIRMMGVDGAKLAWGAMLEASPKVMP